MVMTRPATKTAVPLNSTQSIDQSPSNEGVVAFLFRRYQCRHGPSDKGRDPGSSARQTAARRCTVMEFRLALPAVIDGWGRWTESLSTLGFGLLVGLRTGELRPHRDDVYRVPPHGKSSASYRKLSWKSPRRIVTPDLLTTTIPETELRTMWFPLAPDLRTSCLAQRT
jgi:hypothetical protein